MEIPNWLKEDDGNSGGGAGGTGGGYAWTSEPPTGDGAATGTTPSSLTSEIEPAAGGGGRASDNSNDGNNKRRFTCWNMMKRDSKLWFVTILILVVMNIPLIRFALYPFVLFSTWIHETCHGIACLMVGGVVDKLNLYPDTTGLATTAIPISVSSASACRVSSTRDRIALTPSSRTVHSAS